MVAHSGTPVRSDQLRALNRPRPCRVITTRDIPTAIREGARTVAVLRVQDRWQVNDEWWRDPIDRHYFEMVMEDGRIRTVFHDRDANLWYEQRA